MSFIGKVPLVRIPVWICFYKPKKYKKKEKKYEKILNIDTFIRTDGNCRIYFIWSETIPSACYILFKEHSIPPYSTSNRLKNENPTVKYIQQKPKGDLKENPTKIRFLYKKKSLLSTTNPF